MSMSLARTVGMRPSLVDSPSVLGVDQPQLQPPGGAAGQAHALQARYIAGGLRCEYLLQPLRQSRRLRGVEKLLTGTRPPSSPLGGQVRANSYWSAPSPSAVRLVRFVVVSPVSTLEAKRNLRGDRGNDPDRRQQLLRAGYCLLVPVAWKVRREAACSQEILHFGQERGLVVGLVALVLGHRSHSLVLVDVDRGWPGEAGDRLEDLDVPLPGRLNDLGRDRRAGRGAVPVGQR